MPDHIADMHGFLTRMDGEAQDYLDELTIHPQLRFMLENAMGTLDQLRGMLQHVMDGGTVENYGVRRMVCSNTMMTVERRSFMHADGCPAKIEGGACNCVIKETT